jgi:hypothetical protein
MAVVHHTLHTPVHQDTLLVGLHIVVADRMQGFHKSMLHIFLDLALQGNLWKHRYSWELGTMRLVGGSLHLKGEGICNME